MVIYLDQYRATAVIDSLLKNGTYGNEMTNTTLPSKVIHLPQSKVAVVVSTTLPEDLATADVDPLLERVYALATQI